MQFKKITTGMLEVAYELVKGFSEGEGFDPETLSALLGRHYDAIPVWCDMYTPTKVAAIKYVYDNRNNIELHSGCVAPWVQATAYYMVCRFFGSIIIRMDDGIAVDEIIDISPFFDDLDFMSIGRITDPRMIKVFNNEIIQLISEKLI